MSTIVFNEAISGVWQIDGVIMFVNTEYQALS